jgi:Asp-tRNA(Asn)/Glu-tRNA(Gln) amidotransferase B subunit
MDIPQDRLALAAAMRAKRESDVESEAVEKNAIMDRAIDRVLASKPKALADFSAGKASALNVLVNLVRRLEPDLDGAAVLSAIREKLNV